MPFPAEFKPTHNLPTTHNDICERKPAGAPGFTVQQLNGKLKGRIHTLPVTDLAQRIERRHEHCTSTAILLQLFVQQHRF